MDEVSDIIGLTKLDDTLVQESIADAKTKRDNTVDALNTFDSTQNSQLTPIETSIQSMKEWVQNIEGLFKEGLTDVDFPADKWSGIAANSSLGMAIAAQQAPIGSVAYALHQQNQLDMMLQASLSHMAPIQFGLGGYAHKSYPTYGPMMLGLGNLSPDDGIGGSVKQVSGSTDAKLEEVQAKRGKDESDSGKKDWLASSAKGIFNFLTEDIQTIVDPEASAGEKIEAAFFTVFKPAKVADKIADAVKGIEKAADTVDDVKDATDNTHSTSKADQKATRANPKVIEELEGPVIDGERIGSGKKVDDVKPVWGRDEKGRPIIEKEFPHLSKEDGFSDVIDNYSRFADEFSLVGGDEIKRRLFQIERSNNGKKGVFEWIVEPNGDVSHRRFIDNGTVTGTPNQITKNKR